jgi:hypothetical protein
VPSPRLLAFAPLALAALACGSPGSSKTPAAPAVATFSCPPPMGPLPKEDCAEIADDFGALQVGGALQIAGTRKGVEPRLEAIRAVAALADTIKDRRVKLCQSYVKCKVPVADHDAEDQLLTGAMISLIDLWNKRRFSSADEVLRFRAGVRAIDVQVNGDGGPPPPSPPRTLKADDALVRVEDPGVSFRSQGGVVTISATTEGKREALRGNQENVVMTGGRRYRVRVLGRYVPAAPPLIQPGDDLVARLKYRAGEAADVTLALRSLEDPEASESTDTWHVAAKAKGAHEAKLTADPQQTGFYLGVSVRGAPVDLDDIELLRGGTLLAAARAETDAEPFVKTDCTVAAKPIAGKRSLACAEGAGDRVTLGKPEGYLVLTLRDAAGERGSVRTLSLEGGRSVDGLLKEDGGQVVVTLVGAGTATIEKVEIIDLGF